jgi:RNA polymerase sigma factor (sigma-70 family)
MSRQDATGVDQLVDHLFRHQAGKMVSVLTRIFGVHNLELAEDIVQDTLHEALLDWSLGNIPGNPGGWLMTVAKRKASNRIRRERFFQGHPFPHGKNGLREQQVSPEIIDIVFLEHEIKDSQLRMIFTCCNPGLSKNSQVALTLKILCGFSVKEIAHSLLTVEDSIEKRIYRAKEKIRKDNIPFEIPSGKELYQRLDAVCLTIYLIFNEGYASSCGDQVIRKELCLEAIRLALLLTEEPVAGHPKIFALLALMFFHAARLDARLNDVGAIILLEQQDRTLWNQELITKGFHFLTLSSGASEISAYHIEAGIAAQHCLAKTFDETDWQRIYLLYGDLEIINPSPVISLNKAIILGKINGARQSIDLLHRLENEKTLSGYYLLPASLGEFYLQANEPGYAKQYFQRAKNLVNSKAGSELLENKIKACDKN